VSVLFERSDRDPAVGTAEVPEVIADLHLDDIVRSVTTGREIYQLDAFFYQPLLDREAIDYRHEVFRDLEDDAVLAVVRGFARRMREVHDHLEHARRVRYRYEQERWFLEAADVYGEAVAALAEGLGGVELRSRGLRGFRAALAEYAASPAFGGLRSDIGQVLAALAEVRYRLRIQGPRVTVSRYADEPDQGAEVVRTFDKFRQGQIEPYRFSFSGSTDMNHVEAAILERVARLQPPAFAALETFRKQHAGFLDERIDRFEREIQFYVGYLELMERLHRAGLPFCYPEVGGGSRAMHAEGLFDLALAVRLVEEGAPLVLNDCELGDQEAVIVVSGPNQGGKTTFARAIGQLHHLARIGVPVPGNAVRLDLVDRIYTHFERQEQVEDLSSKLEDDLRRIAAILEAATPRSLLIMNESFSSTTVGDQLYIGRRVMRSTIDRGLTCVMVTFLDELASFDPRTVSMVSTVDPDEPARRTFKVVRRPADGLAYAMAIAERHRLSYPALKARLAR
jgi:DNA mismatch repair protein MutS